MSVPWQRMAFSASAAFAGCRVGSGSLSPFPAGFYRFSRFSRYSGFPRSFAAMPLPPKAPVPPPLQPSEHSPAQGAAAKTVHPSRHPTRTFRDELFGGIGRRLAREMAEREQAAALRRAGEPVRRWAMTLTVVACLMAGYYLGTYYPSAPEEHSTAPLAATQPPTYKTLKQDLQAAWAEFVVAVGRDNVSTSPENLQRHTTSTFTSHPPDPSVEPPFCVVYPGSTAEVVAVVRICHARRIPLIVFSGGTSVEGQFTPVRRCVCVDMARMNRILEVHPDDLDVVVQPAVDWQSLNEHLAPHRLFFPPDPGPGAHVGGMIGTGCSGTNAYRYGTMRDWVLGLTVVLADGTVIQTRRRPRKSSAGYNLTQLFIGSEGTLGIVTEATLRLAPVPRHSTVAVCAFPTLRAAVACATDMVVHGTTPVAAIELLDDAQMAAVNIAGVLSRNRTEAPTLFFRLSADDVAVIGSQAAALREAANRAGALSIEVARPDSDEVEELWTARKQAIWSAMAASPEGSDRFWGTDVAVPMSRLPDIIEQTQEWLRESGLFGTIVGHLGDGNFHLCLCFAEHQRPKAEALVYKMIKVAIEMDGTVSGEHGVGLVKRDYLALELGQDTVDTMRKIKLALDPLCLLNCDKVVRMETPKRRLLG